MNLIFYILDNFKIHLSKNVKFGWIYIMFFVNVGCLKENQEINLLLEAQSCLNHLVKLSTSEAKNKVFDCVKSLEGIESKAAYQLRCSAIFIHQGFSSGERMSVIIEKMLESQEGGNSSSSTLNAMGFLLFTEDASSLGFGGPQYMANLAQNYCSKSPSSGMALLASLSNLVTSLGDIENIASSCINSDSTECATQVKDVLCEAKDDDNKKQQLGQIVVNGFSASCSQNQSNNPICSIYSQAINNNNNYTEIGEQLINQLSENCSDE